MLTWSSADATRIVEEVKRRSLTDKQFRQLALSNPTAALAQIQAQPAVGSILFVEAEDAPQKLNDSGVMIVVLPRPDSIDVELSDEDLENVAGGGGGSTVPPVGIS